MEIIVKNLSRTCLQEKPFLRLIKKYSSNLKNSIHFSFDLRLKDLYGNYYFGKRTHIIKISIPKCCFTEKKTKLDANAQKYQLISTIIHELYHAQQKEELGPKFYSDWFSCAPGVRDPDVRSSYSRCELAARIFEDKNILKAIQYYNTCEE